MILHYLARGFTSATSLAVNETESVMLTAMTADEVPTTPLPIARTVPSQSVIKRGEGTIRIGVGTRNPESTSAVAVAAGIVVVALVETERKRDLATADMTANAVKSDTAVTDGLAQAEITAIAGNTAAVMLDTVSFSVHFCRYA